MNNHPHDAREEAQPGGADDPRLTAYALGELGGAEHAADSVAMQALLERDPAARAAFAELRELAGELTRDLAAEAAQLAPEARLRPEQRRAIESALPRAAAVPVRASASGGLLRRLRFVPALAAGLLIAVVTWQLWEEGAPASVRDAARKDEKARSAGADGAVSRAAPGDVNPALERLRGLGYLGAGGGTSASAANQDVAMAPLVDRPQMPDVAFEMVQASPVPASHGTSTDTVSAEMADALKSYGYMSSDGAGSGGSAPPAAPAAEAPSSQPGVTGSTSLGSSSTLLARGRPSGVKGREELESRLAALGYIENDDADGETALRFGLDDRNRDQGFRYHRPTPGGEGYEPIVETGFQSPLVAPRSTFSVDVDTASYANVRRFLNAGQLPPADAVRLEELINYFHYDYPQPDGEHPFSVTADVTSCPWAESHRLVRIGLQGRTVPQAERAPTNLVFLVDVSGSMNSPDKLPLVQASLRLLVGKLDARDRIALVAYAGNAGLVLDSTGCAEKQPILDALDRLSAGGSTAGGAGIALAYQVAAQHFIKGGTNRVILATDGDFNVGVTSREDLQALIERSAKTGVFLTVLGYGTGNLKDGTAELLADKGNGNYAYIDSLAEAQKVLVQQMGGTLIAIAKDVKLQVEFNPGRVAAYRLLGYENRALATRDFNDDRKDAGEIGSGHSVTALYEVIPVGAVDAPAPDALRYQKEAPVPAAPPVVNDSPELLYVALRYKQPAADVSTLLGQPLVDEGGRLGVIGGGSSTGASVAQAAADLQFAAAVAEFGMLLRGSGHAGSASWDSVRVLAEAGRGADRDGYRAEFLRLVGIAQSLAGPANEQIKIGYIEDQPQNRR